MRSSTGPGKLPALRYWRAVPSAVSTQAGSIFNLDASDNGRSSARARSRVSSGDSGSSRAISRTLRSAGRSRSRRAVLAGEASVHITSRPAAMAGRIWSRMLAAWP